MAENIQSFKPIKKRRLSDEVTAQIRASIAAGDIVPGDKLPAERQMADSFAVSRGAVREALRNLELAGVVDMQHGVHGGAFVTNGNPDIMGDNLKDLLHLGGISLHDLTEARIWIETIVTQVACERATEADLRELTDNVDEAETLLKQRRYDDKIAVHIEFHNILARATHNPVMVMLMSALMQVMSSFSYEIGGEKNDLTIRARRKFLGFMRKRDSEGAVKAMVDHVKQLQKRYEKVAAEKRGT